MPGAISDDTRTPAPAEGVCGIYHITHPRSASNLFQNMMGKQPGLQYSSYKLFGAGFGALTQLQRGPLGEWPEEDRERLFGLFEAGFEGIQDEVAGAMEGVSFNFFVILLLVFSPGGYAGRKREREKLCWGGVLGPYVWSGHLHAIRSKRALANLSLEIACSPLGSHDKASNLLIELIPTDIVFV